MAREIMKGADAVTGTVDVENVVWKDGGWVGLLADDGWVCDPIFPEVGA